jgi:hypothetical protein
MSYRAKVRNGGDVRNNVAVYGGLARQMWRSRAGEETTPIYDYKGGSVKK